MALAVLASGADGLGKFVHVKLLVLVPLVADDAARGGHVIFAGYVVHGLEAVAVAPDGEDVFLGRAKQGAQLHDRADGGGVAELQPLGLLSQAAACKALLAQLVQVGLAVEFEPHDVARVGILAAKRLPLLRQILAVLVEAHHADVAGVGEVRLQRIHELILDAIVHLAAGVAIDVHRVAGLSGHRQQFALAPLVELCNLGGVGLVEGHFLACTAYRQTVADKLIGIVPRAVGHRDGHVAALGGVGERLVLQGHGLVVAGEVHVAYARAIGVECPHVPRLAVGPHGVSLARQVADPGAHQGLAVRRLRCRVVVVVTGACRQHHHCHHQR